MSLIKLVIAVLVSLATISCSITKRHFRAGYDVTWHHRDRSADETDKKDALITTNSDALPENLTDKPIVDSAQIVLTSEQNTDPTENVLANNSTTSPELFEKPKPEILSPKREKVAKLLAEVEESNERRMPLAVSLALIPLVLFLALLVSIGGYFFGYILGEVLFKIQHTSILEIFGKISAVLVAALALFGYFHLFDKKELKKGKTRASRNVGYVFFALLLAIFIAEVGMRYLN
ncbi:MAG: hypothetical protein WC044_07495 [Crocinitomicaceae bacterium]